MKPKLNLKPKDNASNSQQDSTIQAPNDKGTKTNALVETAPVQKLKVI